MAQEIVFYHSAMTGAPSSTLNAAGAVITVLDAVLVNGFNVNTVSTLTRSGTTATATTSGTNGFSINDWVLIAGADQSAYNGRVKVTSKPASNQFTFEVAGSPTTPATGTITAKYPGAGWAKTTAGTNNAAYQGGGLGLWVQVEDNNPYADSHVGVRMRLAQGWTALDTATVIGTQINMHKATGGWMVFADAKTAYIFWGPLGGNVKSCCFGEFAPFYSGDAFSAFISGGRTSDAALRTCYDDASSAGSDYLGSQWPAARYVTTALQAAGVDSSSNLRGISQVGASVVSGPLMVPGSWLGVGNQTCNQFVAQGMFTPSLADNSIPIGPIFNQEFASPNYTLRGRHRGVYWPLGRMSGGFTNGFQRLDNALVDGVTQPLVLITMTQAAVRQLAFQVDGAWS